MVREFKIIWVPRKTEKSFLRILFYQIWLAGKLFNFRRKFEIYVCINFEPILDGYYVRNKNNSYKQNERGQYRYIQGSSMFQRNSTRTQMCTQLIRSQVEDQVRLDVLRKELNCQLREIDILHFVSFAGRKYIEKDWLCLDHL